MSALQGPAPTFYTKDQLLVQVELIEAIDIRFLPILQAIFNTEEWLFQNQPIPRKLIRALCLKDPLTDKFICVFCPDRTFNQSGHTIEHLQQHFGLRPFHCTAPNWYGFLGYPRLLFIAKFTCSLLNEKCVFFSAKTFLRKNELKNHSRTHAAPGRVPCPNNW
jgi:hypothetical protein